jgi:hypothetical protein
MTQKEKQLRAFFAEKISKKLVWGDNDTERMLDFLDPVWPNSTPLEEAKHLTERTKNFMIEFDEWQAEQPKPQEKLPPMTDAEVDALAAIL